MVVRIKGEPLWTTDSEIRTMVFTVGTLFEAGLLLINAIAILNEERFLQKGMSSSRLNVGC